MYLKKKESWHQKVGCARAETVYAARRQTGRPADPAWHVLRAGGEEPGTAGCRHLLWGFWTGCRLKVGGGGWPGALALGLDPREAAAVPFTPGSRTSPSGAPLAEPWPTSSESSDLDAGVSQRRSQQRHFWHHHMHKDATKGNWEQRADHFPRNELGIEKYQWWNEMWADTVW